MSAACCKKQTKEEQMDLVEDLVERRKSMILAATEGYGGTYEEATVNAVRAVDSFIAAVILVERDRMVKWLYEPDPASPGNYIHINVLGNLEFIMIPDLLSILLSFPPKAPTA
jgi:hypothetical protein